MLSVNTPLAVYFSCKLHNEWNAKYYPTELISLIFVQKRSLFKEGLGQLN